MYTCLKGKINKKHDQEKVSNGKFDSVKNGRSFLVEKKGVSLVSLIVAIVVMLIIVSMLIYIGSNNTNIAKIAKVNADVDLLNDKVNNYYLKNYDIPIEREDTLKKVLNPKEIINQLGDNRNEEDNDIYYIVDPELLENVTLNTGGTEGKFIVNDQTHTVYYVEGDVLEKIPYYTIEDGKSDVPMITITPNTAIAKIGSAISVKINVIRTSSIQRKQYI